MSFGYKHLLVADVHMFYAADSTNLMKNAGWFARKGAVVVSP